MASWLKASSAFSSVKHIRQACKIALAAMYSRFFSSVDQNIQHALVTHKDS